MMENPTTSSGQKQPDTLTAGNRYISCTLQLDRLSFVGNLRNKLVSKNDSNREVQAFGRFENDLGLSERKFAQYPYRYQWKHVLGFTVQYSDDKNTSDIRVDCNPNLFNTPALLTAFHAAIDSILENLRHVKITRVDLAIDFPFDLSTYYMATDQPKSSSNYLSASKCLETQYLGGRGSAEQFRVYDKQKQSGLDNVKWRVEAQYRFRATSELLNLVPFAGLQISKPVTTGTTPVDAIFLHALQTKPELFGALDKRTRAKYRKMFREDKTDDIGQVCRDIALRDMGNLISMISAVIDVEKNNAN